ncbi:MAG: carbohydrate ABC transporter permease [Chthonomonadales bacterium]|nr:carbohydrate ABC transporter permease [Chthonomonadales bacterium]
MTASALRWVGPAVRYACLIAYLVAVLFPVCWVFYTSAKSTQQIYRNPFGLPPAITAPGRQSLQPLVENYTKAWVGSRFSRYFINSVIVVSTSLVSILMLGSMAAYVLARFHFRGRTFVHMLFICGLLIPVQLVLIPLFFQFSDMGDWLTRILGAPVRALGIGDLTVSLHDSHIGLILIYVAFSLPFTVFTLTAFFRTLPGELREAALIDGAGEYRTFFSVMMPLGRPGIVTIAIFNFLGLWNEYLFGLVFLNDDRLKTLPLGLASISMQAQYKSDFGLLFAALVIAMVPTIAVYMVLQEKLTRGITLGALKG